MLLLDTFCNQNNIDRSTAYRWRDSGKIFTKVIAGKTHVFETQDELNYNENIAPKFDVEEIKQKFNSMIIRASKNPEKKKEVIKFIESEITRLAGDGIKIVGYDTKSLYRKIKKISSTGLGARALQRKERADKHIIRNVMLSKNLDKLLPLAAYLYFECATPNISGVVKHVQYFAKMYEDYYEFAAIPAATLKRTITNEFKHSGYDNLHKFLNHHNIWRNTLPRVTGAFTDHSKFMDVIVGDDHKSDVFKVFVYDENAGKVIEKKVQIWTWCEEKTGYDLGHIIKIGDINSEDVLNSMVELIQMCGLPHSKFKVDQGIAKSERIQKFMERLDLPGAVCTCVEAYAPTAKALRERSFGFYKNEFDAFCKNFIGPDKEKESRHSGRQLSPEETNLWFDDYKNALENYLTGFYADVPRKRVINDKVRTISIREFFDEEWQKYTPRFVDNQKLRYALSQQELKRFTGQLKFKGQTFIPAEVPPVSFYNRNYIVLFNPQDLSAVDLYAHDSMVNYDTGEVYNRGQLVMTLNNTKQVNDPRVQVSNLKKEMEKGLNQLSATMASTVLKDQKFSPIQTTPSGEVVNRRKEVQKRAKQMLTEVISSINITSDMLLQPEETEESTLDYSEDTTSTSLTYED